MADMANANLHPPWAAFVAEAEAYRAWAAANPEQAAFESLENTEAWQART